MSCAGGKSQLADSGLGINLNMGRKSLEFHGKRKDFGGQLFLRKIAELGVHLSMRRKLIELPKENKGFRGSIVLTDIATCRI